MAWRHVIAELLLGHLRAGPGLFFRRRMNG
jgi:hypothetical protein